MPSKIMQEILQLIEREAESRIPAVAFEMAYQARVAIDRIRFAIKHTEQFGPHTEQMREAALQLLDALERLESADRSFQRRLRVRREFRGDHIPGRPLNGKVAQGEDRGSI